MSLKPDIEPRIIQAAQLRQRRSRTTQITLHKFGVEPLTADGIERFFTEDPEGVATVTIAGSYRSKLPIIQRWRDEGVPVEKRIRSYVPYHVVVEPSGKMIQFLPWLAKGAHDRYSNLKGIGVAILGDLDKHEPTPEQMDSLRSLLKWMVSDKDFHAAIKADQGKPSIYGHDDMLTRNHEKPKGCPGRHLDARDLHNWAHGVSKLIDMGHKRF